MKTKSADSANTTRAIVGNRLRQYYSTRRDRRRRTKAAPLSWYQYGIVALHEVQRQSEAERFDRASATDGRGRAMDNYRRDVLAQLYGTAQLFQTDSAEWRDFCKLPYWKSAKRKPSFKKPEEALRHTIHYFYQTTGDKKAQQQASKHYLLLKPFYERQAEVEEVRAALSRGIENLRRDTSRHLASERPCTVVLELHLKDFARLEKGKELPFRLCINEILGQTAMANTLPPRSKLAMRIASLSKPSSRNKA